MDKARFEALNAGDVIRRKDGPEGCVVCANYGKAGVVVTRMQLISNPSEWDLILKADSGSPDPLITDLGYGGCEKDYNPITKVYEPCTHRLSDLPDELRKNPDNVNSEHAKPDYWSDELT